MNIGNVANPGGDEANFSIERIERLAAKHDRLREQLDLIHSDLKALLDELGLFSGAQPDTPHDVVHRAIRAAGILRDKLGGMDCSCEPVVSHDHACRLNADSTEER